MNRFWSKSAVTLVASGLFATVGQADLAEFNAINAAARAARERGDQAALLANVRKPAAFIPGHPAVQVALARGLALDEDGVTGSGEREEPVLIRASHSEAATEEQPRPDPWRCSFATTSEDYAGPKATPSYT